jgi:hypothetical protein
MLDFQLEVLNDHSKCRYQIGGSYGYSNLELCSMETTGIRSISMGNTKKELYYQLLTLNEIRSQEKRNKTDYVRNCTHLDTFNLHSFEKNEKRDMGHIREYNGKFTCLCCRKSFNEFAYMENHKPRSAQELRDLRIE